MRTLQREDRQEPDKNIINEDQREKERKKARETDRAKGGIQKYILKDEKWQKRRKIKACCPLANQ